MNSIKGKVGKSVVVLASEPVILTKMGMEVLEGLCVKKASSAHPAGKSTNGSLAILLSDFIYSASQKNVVNSFMIATTTLATFDHIFLDSKVMCSYYVIFWSDLIFDHDKKLIF